MSRVYGRRVIPRNLQEFEDLIYPYYQKRDYPLAIDLLVRYWRRKGKSGSTAWDISAGIVASAFNGDLKVDLRFLLHQFGVGPDGHAYDQMETFLPYFHEVFTSKHTDIKRFLEQYIHSVHWQNPDTLIYKPKSISTLNTYVKGELNYDRSIEYGKTHNRADILCEGLIQAELISLMAKAISNFRESLGLSRNTIKWQSEQYLLEKIQLEFSHLIVIGQGSPKWLEGQRFDIWIPEISAAIEYNGRQHYEPVDFFGGEEGFRETQKRDENKRAKCEVNGTSLLEVQEGYSLEKVYTWITNLERRN